MRRGLLILALLLVGCGGSALQIAPDAGPSRDADQVDAATDSTPAGQPVDRDAATDANAATRPDGACIASAFKRNGVCACGDDTFTPCGDRCVDLQNDDESCGACGHACLPGAPCSAGTCQPTAIEVLPARPGPCKRMDLTVAGGALFWADQAAGEIRGMPTTGATPSTIAAGEDAPFAIAVQGATAYWLAGSTSRSLAATFTLRAAPIAGGPATTVVAPAGGVGAFTVSPDGQTIYFSTSNTIAKVPASASGAPPVVVAQDPAGGFPGGLAIDGAHLAFFYGDHVQSALLVEGSVAMCASYDAASGNDTSVNCRYIGKQLNGPSVVVTSGGQVYWASYGEIRTNELDAGSTQSTRLLGTTFGNDDITAFAVSGPAVFYADVGSSMPPTGTIGKLAPTASEASIRLARDQPAPQSIAADAAGVYWSTVDCAIRALSR